MPFKVALESDLEAMAMNREAMRCRWSTVRRYLADQYKLSPAQLERAAPWAHRRWRELVQEHVEYLRREAAHHTR
jgi:hypothetical protein